MFKEDFKYYKSRNPPPNLDQVVDFGNTKFSEEMIQCTLNTNQSESQYTYGVKPINEWQVYELKSNPGLIFIRNPFTTIGQRYWIVRCLHDYSKKPNKLNIDIHNLIPNNQDWWQVCQETKDKKLLVKLRWATLGYHHNWDTKVYSEDLKNDFPSDLAALSKYVANALGYKHFKAEAAIVNFYHTDSTLSGHTDHSEQFLEAPLLSFSFGQSAIFLLGGQTLDIKPTAMFLRSGDIIVMSKESRHCYHGVPKIIADHSSSPWNSFDGLKVKNTQLEEEVLSKCEDEDFWKPFNEYLKESRINLNVRRVLPIGKTHL